MGGIMRWLAVAAFAASAGCASPAPVAVITQQPVRLEGRTVVWSTDQPTLACVCYGVDGEGFTAVAYPAGAMRPDKSYATEHRVPLLGMPAGGTVVLEVLDRTTGGNVVTSAPYRFSVPAVSPAPALLEWTMIDVGFGDSHLLTMPTTGKRILIDAGERRDWPNVDRYLRSRQVSALDVVMATHVHLDHVGGLIGGDYIDTDGVLGAWDTGLFIDSPDKSADRWAYDEILHLLALRGIPRAVVSVGATNVTDAALAWDPDVQVTVLNSGDGAAAGGDTENDWLNNDSIMLRLSYGEVDLILGGDAESPAERRAIARWPSIQSELLKVHHHGVSDASDPAFLAAVNPRVGLIPISAYESWYGTLPSGEVLDRLAARAIDVFTSDRAQPLGIVPVGDVGYNVTVVTDGDSYEVRVTPSQSTHYPGETYARHEMEASR